MSIMTSAATVYAGPSLSGAYPSIGQIQKDRVVTAIFTENGFAFVEFTPPNTNRKTRGYVERGKIFINEEVDIFAAESKTRYVREAVSTFYGSSYNYNAGEQLQADKMVSYLGRKEQNYAFIEYSTGVNFKRAYVNSNYLSMPLEDRLDQILADFNNAGYKSLNKYSHGQCTWYCWGRAYEMPSVTESSTMPIPSRSRASPCESARASPSDLPQPPCTIFAEGVHHSGGGDAPSSAVKLHFWGGICNRVRLFAIRPSPAHRFQPAEYSSSNGRTTFWRYS